MRLPLCKDMTALSNGHSLIVEHTGQNTLRKQKKDFIFYGPTVF